MGSEELFCSCRGAPVSGPLLGATTHRLPPRGQRRWGFSGVPNALFRAGVPSLSGPASRGLAHGGLCPQSKLCGRPANQHPYPVSFPLATLFS